MCMSSQEMTVEQARAKLGDLVLDAIRGNETVLTRYGKRVARIVPLVPTTYSYAIEVSDDGQIWMPESDDTIGHVTDTDPPDEIAAEILGRHVYELPGDQWGWYRVALWTSPQPDHIGIAVAIASMSPEQVRESKGLAADENAMTATYELTTEEGAETIAINRDGTEVREAYTVDGTVCDNRIAYQSDSPGEVEEYLRRRDIELTSDGYTQA